MIYVYIRSSEIALKFLDHWLAVRQFNTWFALLKSLPITIELGRLWEPNLLGLYCKIIESCLKLFTHHCPLSFWNCRGNTF